MHRHIRVLRADYSFGQHMGKEGDTFPLTMWEWFSRILHLALLLGMTAVVFIALGMVASASDATKASFLTSTFLSTYYTSNQSLAWSPPTNPAAPARLTDTYFACLRSASVGFDESVGCNQDDPAVYKTCLIKKTGSQAYRAAREKAYWARVLEFLRTEHVNYNAVAALQTQIDIDSIITSVQNASPEDVGKIVANYHDKGMISAYALARITREASYIQGIAGCIKRHEITGGTLHPLSTTYDELWSCTTGVIDTDAGQGRLFKKCTALSPWPTIDELQTPYSTQFLGSYNRMFLLVVAAWILNSFLVYTAWIAPWNGYPRYSDIGKVKTLWGATGPALTALCALWNAGGIFLLVPMTQTDGAISMTLQTIYISVVLLMAAASYFIWNLIERAYDPQAVPEEQYGLVTTAPSQEARYAAVPVVPMKGYMRPIQEGGEKKEDITPILTQAWSDAAIPTEALFVLAVLGIAKDVVTADVGRIFISTLVGAGLHSALVRILYEGYMYKTSSAGTPIHRIAAFTVMASLWNAFSVWILAYKRYNADSSYAHSIIISYIVFTSIIPVTAWLVYFLILDFGTSVGVAAYSVDFKNSLHNVTRASFHFAVLVRLIFIALVLGFTGKEDNQDLSDLYFQFTG